MFEDEEEKHGGCDEESWMMLDTEERKRRKEEANRREAAHHQQQQGDTQPARSLGEFIDHRPPLTDDPRPPLLCCAVDCVRDEDLTQLSRQLRGQPGAGPELVAALLVAARSVHLTS